ncbi:phage N-6-adenine-methyltransferase [Escherichia coli]
MSTKLTGYVWDGCAASGMKLSSVAIMARLADFSNDEGVCWPSIETIARQIGAGMSTVRTAIARLEAEGWLTRKARRQGMRYIMKHASAMRDKGGRYVFLIKAATSEVWWPEDADHIAFIRGRIGFELPAWFIPKDEKQVPTGAFFAGAIAVFDKTWKGPAISYIGRDELEACGEAFLAQVRQQAEKLVREMAA